MSLLRASPYRDGQLLDVAGHPVRLTISARARRISLRLDRRAHEILAIAPSARGLADAAAFAVERRAWVAAQLKRAVDTPSLVKDGVVSVFGESVRLEPGPGRARLAPGEDGARIIACGRDAVDLWTAGRVIRRHAQGWFEAGVAEHCAALGVGVPAVATADARARWGSCTPAQRGRPASIRLSWRLALAPRAVADYVVAHECAHLLEANHSPRFWAHVHRLVGDHRPHRAWLRTHGASLQAFGRD